MSSNTAKDLLVSVYTLLLGMSIGGAIMLFVFLASKETIREQGRNQAYTEARKLGLGEWVTTIEVSDGGSRSTIVNWKWNPRTVEGK